MSIPLESAQRTEVTVRRALPAARPDAHAVTAVRTAPAVPDLLPSSRRNRRAFLLPAVLLGADLAAFGVAVALTAAVSVKTFGLLVLVLVLFESAGLYRRRLSYSILDDAPAIVGRALAAGAAAMVLAGLGDGRAGIARVVTSALFGVLAVVVRALAYALIRWLRRRHHLRRRALILGAGSVANALAENLLAHPEYGLRPEGMLDDDPFVPPERAAVPVLGGYDELSRILLQRSIGVVIVTFGSAPEPAFVRMLRACDRMRCEIYFVPRLFELHSVTKETEVLWGVPLLRMRRAPFRTGLWMGKRVLDLAIASTAVIVMAPVLLICALLCRWETGTVLFRQTRIGLDGRPFTLLKFCSLRPAAETESSTRWTIGTDERVRPFGRLLRRTSLDELPQLWNVIRGDMSLVGPRPERPYFVDEFTRQFPFYMARHRVPVGLTGWAQIHGLRGDTSIADRARFDNFYIENWSMWGDVKILLRTFGQVLKAAGR
jgi:exopolysaccharide biosynthesis polyprenyl glycosylphosphotransferase